MAADPARAANENKRQRLAVLVAGMGLAVAVALGVSAWSRRQQTDGVVDINLLGQGLPFIRAQQQEGSILATVQGDAWFALSEEDRLKAVTETLPTLALVAGKRLVIMDEHGDVLATGTLEPVKASLTPLRDRGAAAMLRERLERSHSGAAPK